MTINDFVRKYGTRGLGIIVTRALEEAEEGRSDEIRTQLERILQELQEAFEAEEVQ